MFTHALSKKVVELTGVCSKDMGAPPYWPWVQALRPYIEECPEDMLERQLGAGASIIAAAFEDVRYRFPELQTGEPDTNPERARFSLFDALTQFIRRAAKAQRMLIVLEDLHSADEPSLRLLTFVARQLYRIPLIIAGSYRDADLSRDHPLYRVLGEFAGETNFTRISLQGWEQRETAYYLDLLGIRGLPISTISEIHMQSDGLPLFVSEMARLIESAPDPHHAGQTAIPISAGIKEAIGHRLDQQSEECNRVLRLAALFGQRFSSTVLDRMASNESRPVVDPLNEAEAAGLIDADGGRPGNFLFRHALIQRTLYLGMPATTRARLHAEAGFALEQIYGEHAAVHAAEIARHYAMAGDFGDQTKLFHFSSVAAERALSVYAYDDAMEYFVQALAAVGEHEMNLEAARLLYGIGRSNIPMENFDRHERPLEQAFDICDALGEDELGIEIALALDYHSRATRLKRRALELVEPGSANRAVLLAQYALQLTFVGEDSEKIEDLFSESQAIAKQLDDPELTAAIVRSRARVEYHHGNWANSMESSEEAVTLANRLGNDRLSGEAYIRVGTIYGESGQLVRALEAGRRALSFAERSSDRWLLNWALLLQCQNRLECGELDLARELNDRVLSLIPDFFQSVGLRVEIELYAGNIADGSRHLENYLQIVDEKEFGGGVPHWKTSRTLSMWVFLTGRDDLLERANDAARIVLFGDGVGPAAKWLTWPGIARIATLQKDTNAAALWYSKMQAEYGKRTGQEHLLGMLATVAGLQKEARTHFARAWEHGDARGRVVDLVETGYHFAKLLERADHSDDLRFRAEIVEITLHEARRCGMPLWVEKLESLKQPVAAEKSPKPRPNDLSPREIDVVQLVAEGLTDKSIGEKLFISPKTVGNHLTHIREKTGCHNRAEIVRYAALHNLLEN